MKIGNITLDNPFILAPMAGVTDASSRLLAKEMGCALVYTEMVSAKGLVYGNEHTSDMLYTSPAERPAAIQLFGSDPAFMYKAAQMVESSGMADIIDINMGCPAPKVVKGGDGSALMKDPKLAYDVMRAVVDAVKLPVTVKFRKGWDEAHVNAVEIAKLAEQAGVSAVAVHGRTREQYYSGSCDLSVIADVVEAVSIPVIGNGDIRRPEDAKRMMDKTGCHAVMIGRASEGNPWIFREMNHYYRTGELLPRPTLAERCAMIRRHLSLQMAQKGDFIGLREMRKHAAWYTKGLPSSAQFRMKINRAETKSEFLRLIDALEQGKLEE